MCKGYFPYCNFKIQKSSIPLPLLLSSLPHSNYHSPSPNHSTTSPRLRPPFSQPHPKSLQIHLTQSLQSPQSHPLSREYSPFSHLHESLQPRVSTEMPSLHSLLHRHSDE